MLYTHFSDFTIASNKSNKLKAGYPVLPMYQL